jgi:hypothetical protein
MVVNEIYEADIRDYTENKYQKMRPTTEIKLAVFSNYISVLDLIPELSKQGILNVRATSQPVLISYSARETSLFTVETC